MATIKDVARHAGVAISTASAAINRSAPVSKDVLSAVAAAIRAVGYVPHAGARSLRSGRSNLIGLVVPNIANPWCGAVAREVENVCLAAGYTTVVYSTGQDAGRESQVLEMLRLQRVAGLLVIPTRSDAEHGAALRDQIHVPTVLLDMQVEGLPFDVVKADNVEAGRLGTAHLLGLGHRRIGIVVGIPGLATSDDRLLGYREAHAAAGVTVDERLIAVGNFDQSIAHDAVLGMLKRKDRPTAVMTCSNMMTMGLLFAIRELKLAVPKQLSFVGIDDLEFSLILDPQPTTVATAILPMARQAIKKLITQVFDQKPATGATDVYPPELIVRTSTAALG
ncbi:MAG: LacI family DNA-binding transcriptional regulator [Devosia sp.]|nr:LacI family DNA-binding transcriptional regulator [Devosia sp.]